MRKLEHNEIPVRKKGIKLSPKEVSKVLFKRNQKIARGFCMNFVIIIENY